MEDKHHHIDTFLKKYGFSSKQKALQYFSIFLQTSVPNVDFYNDMFVDLVHLYDPTIKPILFYISTSHKFNSKCFYVVNDEEVASSFSFKTCFKINLKP
jgi:hypothetical protein